jgi:isoleucyl-tRNA synthetase
MAAFDGLDAAEIFRTSKAVLQMEPGLESVAISAGLADGHKCARCWRILPEVTSAAALCLRCEDAVEVRDKAQVA